MNRRGVLAKILSTLPVFLLIIFFTGIFLALVGYVVAIEKPKIPEFIEGIEIENVLAKEITVKINENAKKILIFDALIKYWNGDLDILEIKQALEKMIENEGKEGYCLAMAQGEQQGPAGQTGGAAHDDFLIKFRNGEISSGNIGYNPLGLARYEKNGLLREISFKKLNDKKIIYVQYHYGKCLEEGK